MLGWVARALLLAPEAALVAALLCAYWGLGAPAPIGLAIMLVIISFIARLIALVAAQAALELERPDIGEALVRSALALYPWSSRCGQQRRSVERSRCCRIGRMCMPR